MLDFKASVAAMSLEDIADVLASANQYDEAAREVLVAAALEEEPRGISSQLLNLFVEAANARILSK